MANLWDVEVQHMEMLPGDPGGDQPYPRLQHYSIRQLVVRIDIEHQNGCIGIAWLLKSVDIANINASIHIR